MEYRKMDSSLSSPLPQQPEITDDSLYHNNTELSTQFVHVIQNFL